MLPHDRVRNSVDIVECIDQDEYKALSTAKMQAVDLIVSATFVNMKAGSKSRLKLAEVFPPGTATNAALAEYLGDAL